MSKDDRDSFLKDLKRTLGGDEYAQFKALVKDLKELSKTERPDPRLLRSAELELRTLFRRGEAFAILKESYKHFVPRELSALREVIKAARGSLAPALPAAPAVSLPAPPPRLPSAARPSLGQPSPRMPAYQGHSRATCSSLVDEASMPVAHDLAPAPGLGAVWPGAPHHLGAQLGARAQQASSSAAEMWPQGAAPPPQQERKRADAAPPPERAVRARFEPPPPPAAPPPVKVARPEPPQP